MKIVVLDGYTVNPGDLDWQGLRELGECSFFDRTSPEELPDRVRDADVLLTNKTRLDQAAIAAAPHLRYIGVIATGYNVVDIEAARARGITVTNVPAYGTASMSQGTIALLLELANHVGHHDRSVHQGGWSRSPDFCYWEKPIVELSGLTLGIVGWGNIGIGVAKVAAALGMSVVATSRSQRHSTAFSDVRFLSLPDLLAQADVVSLHCALTAESEGMINKDSLQTMKRSAWLLNTARGGLIVEEDLAAALNTGIIAGAALDVLRVEPPDGSSPLLTARNCIITPHHHWASASSRKRLLTTVISNLQAFLAGKPTNVVCP